EEKFVPSKSAPLSSSGLMNCDAVILASRRPIRRPFWRGRAIWWSQLGPGTQTLSPANPSAKAHSICAGAAWDSCGSGAVGRAARDRRADRFGKSRNLIGLAQDGARSHDQVLVKVPLRRSETACCSSACVFMTIGPYQATGSLIGFPDT